MKKKLLFAVAAILAASLGAPAIAAEPAKDPKANASKDYFKATAKAKADFNAAAAECKKLADDKQSACYKDARVMRRKARDAAGDAYANLMGKAEPSPGGE
ncbi:MAG: hypothetical protein ACXWHZ_18510 [Usitatibacter sp.]